MESTSHGKPSSVLMTSFFLARLALGMASRIFFASYFSISQAVFWREDANTMNHLTLQGAVIIDKSNG
jgi:ABC-type uncharacterized transport system permease subunit